MTRPYPRRSTPGENLLIIFQRIPWRLLLLLPLLALLAIPAFYFGTHEGVKIFPAATNYFYNLTGPTPTPIPTPLPTFSTSLPQAGSLLYTVQSADSCDEILSTQMHMVDASTIFSNEKPETIQALNDAIGQDCNNLQPGMVLALSPQYPLMALAGEVLTVDPVAPQQVLPTPVINVVHQEQLGIDCSGGCQLTVRLSSTVQVRLFVQTTLPVKVGSWVWAQAMMARQNVKDFSDYPYVDPTASLNGMSLRACDLQVDNKHDDNSLSCDQLVPNTIDDDGGAWLFGVTGASSLDHWHYPLRLASGTRVLLWLSVNDDGSLSFHTGNPLFRYDETTHVYVRV